MAFDVLAAIAHYGAAEGWVNANREYTDEAYALAKSNRISLINRAAQLIEMILKLNPGSAPSANTVQQAMPTGEKTCLKCGSKMVLRKIPKASFMVAAHFPNVGS
ncbi:restriction endonuclease [Paenibacillus xerothermodurans]|uniref:Restriction endonuclease type IV Mrr domain-containing protein n=1 Tax=Paenibacillus xerothermodurans TaxID=1977292 RepID=A0A2W1P1B7_PAEXE|nr:hypothetical protein CBW46_009315 [Paenibacillus xerothermodurans]